METLQTFKMARRSLYSIYKKKKNKKKVVGMPVVIHQALAFIYRGGRVLYPLHLPLLSPCIVYTHLRYFAQRVKKGKKTK
jgi:hypothetical protein